MAMMHLLIASVVFVAGLAVVISETPRAPQFYIDDPVGFIDGYLKRNERGEPLMLTGYQRQALKLALSFDRFGRLLIRLLLWSEPKKSGKSTIAPLLAIWFCATRAGQGVRCIANDLDQTDRVFGSAVAILRMNGWEKAEFVTIGAKEIRFKNGSYIRRVAHDEKGEVGGRDTLNIFDEMCLMGSERSYRLWEECTPIPTAPEAWNLIVTTAGYSGEAPLLEGLYARGLAGERIDDDLEVYKADGGMVMFWSHTPRQPWQTADYYAQQRASLRPATYLRLHENRWVSASGSFITDDLWDACVSDVERPLMTFPNAVCVAADGGLKHDMSAVVAVGWLPDGRLRLIAHRIWTPTSGQTLDLETTVEAYLRELAQRFHVKVIRCDPWQMARSIATLRSAGLPIEEYTQTEQHTGQMGAALYDLLRGRNLVLYPDAELRQQALNAVGVEKTHGVHLVKAKASRKIDGIVALSMACVAALENGPEADAGVRLLFGKQWRDEQTKRETDVQTADVADEPPQIETRVERATMKWGAWMPRDDGHMGWNR